MRRNLRLALPLTLLTLSCAAPVREATRPGPVALDYPPAAVSDQVDVYHGVRVADPYRWLEEEDSPATRSWVGAQDALLTRYVGEVPSFERVTARGRQIRAYGYVGLPSRGGDALFFDRRAAGATHGALYRQEGSEEATRVLDFGEMIDEPSHRMSGYSVSPDGSHVVWASLDPKGWGWLDVARTQGGVRLGERIEGVAGGIVGWSHDNLGFFYQAYGDYRALMAGEVDPVARILFHRLGTDPATDEEVYARPDRPSMLFNPKLSDDGRYLVVSLMDGSRTRNQVVYKDLDAPSSAFRDLISEADASYLFEGNVGRRFFFQTTLDAPRRRVVAIDLDQPGRDAWQTVVPQRDASISAVSHIGGRLVVQVSEHARPAVEVWHPDGTLERTLDLPAIGLLAGFADDPEHASAFYRLNSLIDPGTIYRVDLRDGRSVVHHALELAHDPADFEIRQVFFESRDGTRLPMFLAHRKGLALRGDHPLFMYGFGHGGWVAFPWFQPHLVQWMEMGGTYALPGLRGGGEYGAAWQEAGTRLNKQTTIDDYIDATEWLIANGYTSADKMVANGGSASGVVPAAAVLQRPDLYAAAVIDFPFLDMLRYHKFTTVKGWTQGYGSSDDAREFDVLHGYSPVHRIDPGTCYPSILTLVAEKDTATVPMHGYKFTAAMQAAQECRNPVLLKHIPGAGHYSYGTSSRAAAETEAQILAFLIRVLGLEVT